MADPLSNTQLPFGAQSGTGDDELFVQGLAMGQKYAADAMVKARAWAEENPGQFVLAAVAAGFIVGKVLFAQPRRRRIRVD